ncbi:MAG: hypothetical protein P8N76_11080 [Pirellulaceae bacterium]|nr:hypothetical protein [Pirellulaceae bacterium]
MHNSIIISLLLSVILTFPARAENSARRLLYVASPGIRNYLEFGGHGILVYDMDNHHQFLRRIPIGGLDEQGKPLNVKGICANAKSERIYLSTLRHLICLDLTTDEMLWEKQYEGGCDRMSISPNGSFIYLPTLERNHWKVVRGSDGAEITRISPHSGAHNTIVGLDGKRAYLAGLRSPLLTVADCSSHKVLKTVGPFSNSIRPFTINGSQTQCFVNVNDLLGFEIGDLQTGKMLHRVEVKGFSTGPIKRHGCPSHGVGMTPDEKQIWLSDGANSQIHVFDATQMPPVQIDSIPVRDQPGWVTFSIHGDLAYPSTGEVIDVESRKIIAKLSDEKGRVVQSEKMLEIDMLDGHPVAVGDQFGLGRHRSP